MKYTLITLLLWGMASHLLAQDDVILDETLVSSISNQEFISTLPDVDKHLKSRCFTAEEKSLISIFFSQIRFQTWQQIQGIPELDRLHILCFLEDEGALSPRLSRRGEWDEKKRMAFIFKPKMNGNYFLMKGKIPIGRKLRLGYLLERDPGEQLWGHKGPDYWGVYVEYTPSQSMIKKIILGDYRVRFGQGLVYNNFFRKGLVFNHQQIPRFTGKVIMPYQSLDENRALRGISVDLRIKKWNATVFGSFRRQDARLDTVSNLIESYSYSGVHVSPSEILNKDAVAQGIGGLRISRELKSFKIASNNTVQWSSLPWKTDTRIDLRWRTSSPLHYWSSLDYQWNYKNFSFYGEIALHNGKNIATLNGLFWSPHHRHIFSLLHRSIDGNYHSYHSQSFTERSLAHNERGHFLGYSFKPSRQWQVFINLHSYSYPSWSYLQYPWRDGRKWILGITHSRRRKYKLSGQFRVTSREQRSSLTSNEKAFNARLHYVQFLSPGLEWRMRAEVARRMLNDQQYNGWMLYQELKWDPWENPWNGVIRFTLHHTDGFESRIYAYQHALGGVFSIPAHFGRSLSAYCLLRHSFPWGKIQIRGKYQTDGKTSTWEFGTGLTLQWL